MSSHPYSSAAALRSITPPLYYRRPEGAAPSYYTVPTRDVEALRISATHTTASEAQMNVAAPPRASISLHPSLDRASMQRPPPPAAPLTAVPPSPRLSGYAMPSVVNPYTTHTTAVPPHMEPSYSSSSASTGGGYLAPQPTNPAGRWSYSQQPPPPPQQYPTVDPLSARVAAIDAEEAAMAAEEMSLRAKLTELQLVRRRQEEEQLLLSQGWDQMLEKEEQYYTEPLVDRRQDILAHEQHCASLQQRLQQMEAEAQYAQAQLQNSEHVIRDVESFEQERKRIQDGFHDIERRRRECVARAERYFDVEAKRAVEGNKHIRRLDVQLRDMTQRGPLAEAQGVSRSPSKSHRSSSRVVTFAPDKSIVLDFGREESGSSAEPPLPESEGGLTSSYVSSYGTGGTAATASPGFMGIGEDDIGGTSIAFSLNDAREPLAMLKKHKMEIASM